MASSSTPQAHIPLPYSSTPPAPPPKPSSSSSAAVRGPPLPPPPPGQVYYVGSSGIENRPAALLVQPAQSSRSQAIPPVADGWLPESIREKSTQDLQTLLSDPSLQTALLANEATTHSSVTASEQHLKPLISANIALANTTLQLESQLSSLRTRTQERLLSLRALEQQHRAKIAETEGAVKDFSPMALYQRLNASAQEQDQLVAGMEESWLEEDGIASDREVGEFVRRVKDARKVAFLRWERKRRWDEGRVGGWR